ncbi:MAG: hypothetical protein ACI4RT_01020 [Candidatus Spyradenecus sp.]
MVANPARLHAATPPILVTLQRNPYTQATNNVIGAIEKVEAAADGSLTIHISLSLEPTEAPTIAFSLTNKNGTQITLLGDASCSSFPTQSLSISGRYTYAYTLQNPGEQVNPSRIVPVTRLRFGGQNGTTLEGGGYAILESEGIYIGRTGTFSIGQNTYTFQGGILISTNTPADTPAAATYSLRARAAAPSKNTPTNINGHRFSFPVSLPSK